MLDVQDLSFSYGTEPILKHVGFQAQAGCVTSVIGPNGTGKTTLLRCIAGAELATAGIEMMDAPKYTEIKAEQQYDKIVVKK